MVLFLVKLYGQRNKKIKENFMCRIGVIVLISLFLVYSREKEAIYKIEQLLMERKWREATTEARNLSTKNTWFRFGGPFSRVISYLRHVEDCEKMEKGESQIYPSRLPDVYNKRNAKCYECILNSYEGMPKKLPFSSKLISYIDSTKTAALIIYRNMEIKYKASIDSINKQRLADYNKKLREIEKKKIKKAEELERERIASNLHSAGCKERFLIYTCRLKNMIPVVFKQRVLLAPPST